MKHSAQAIVVDREGNIYLERNQKIGGKLSFIGGKIEEGETTEGALVREIKEEIKVIVSNERLLDGQEQKPRIFPTGTWVSTYFVCVLEDSEEEIAKAQDNIEVYDFDALQHLDDEEYPMERIMFLSQVQRALNHLN